MKLEHIDAIDRRILVLLGRDARMTISALADALGVSHTMIHKRYQRLCSRGIVRHGTLVLDKEKLGYTSVTFTGLVLQEAGYSYRVVQALQQIPEVVECHLVSGKYAILIKIVCRDNEHLRKVLYEQVHAIEGVGSTDSFISFGEEWSVSHPILRERPGK